jgi:hypothetical protein
LRFIPHLALRCFEWANNRSEREKRATAMQYPQNDVSYQIVKDATGNEFIFSFTSGLLLIPG